MSDWKEELERIEAEASDLPYGDARTALRDQCVQLADLHQDLDRAFSARCEFIGDATLSGHADKALVAFAWCQGQCERDPRRFDERRIAWVSKHVIQNVLQMVQIPRAQLDRALADFEARWQRLGYSMRTVHMLRAMFAEHYGLDMKPHVNAWQLAPRDAMTHCRACEADILVGYHADWGEHERAIELAAPIVAGRLGCAEVPHRTYARLLSSAVALGRLEDAASYHRRGYRLLRTGNLAVHVAEHLIYCSQIGRGARALDMFEAHLPRVLELREAYTRVRFLLAADVALRLLPEGRKRTLKLNLPDAVPVTHTNGEVEREALHAWVKEQAIVLVERFDARNGTDHFSRLAASHAALELVAPPAPGD